MSVWDDKTTKASGSIASVMDSQSQAASFGSESHDAVKIRVVIVGATDSAKALAEKLESSQNPCYEIVGFLTAGTEEPEEDMTVLGDATDMFEISKKLRVDEVIIAPMPVWHKQLAEFVATNANSHPKIRIVPSVYEAMVHNPKVAQVNDLPLVTLNYEHSACYKFVKRSFDIGFSLCALIASAPVVLIAALLLKISSRGDTLFRQIRVGKDGKEFVLLKLRTMVDNAEKDTGPVLSSPSDGRVTTIGRILRHLKLDELPQFINVLKGEMSVIGPRPERPCFVNEFNNMIPGYNARHQVRPGITGLAQVCGGYSTDPATKLKYDLMYVYGGSLWTDIRIIFLTIPTMITGK